jgi:hypothetical protein
MPAGGFDSIQNTPERHGGAGEGRGRKRMKNRDRRDTSESLKALVRAHAITVRAMENLSPSPSLSSQHGRPWTAGAEAEAISPGLLRYEQAQAQAQGMQKGKSPNSLTDNRHIAIAPLFDSREKYRRRDMHGGTSREDQDDSPNVPAHFIRTPYPFANPKQFPKPPHHGRGREEAGNQLQLKAKQVFGLEPSANDLTSVKGKQVLGWGVTGSEGEFDLRSKYHMGGGDGYGGVGVRRAHSDSGYHGRDSRGWGDDVGPRVPDKEEDGEKEAVLYMSLRHRRGEGGVSSRLERLVVPESLSTRHAGTEKETEKRKIGDLGKGMMRDFDDEELARRLRDAYRGLAGSWFRRTFSARKLRCIRLARVDVWSGEGPSGVQYRSRSSSGVTGARRMLMARVVRGGSEDMDTQSQFSEKSLWDLYQHPKFGKARYAWVHWARRVASCNSGVMANDVGTGLAEGRRLRRSKRRGGKMDLEEAKRGHHEYGEFQVPLGTDDNLLTLTQTMMPIRNTRLTQHC